MSYFLNGSTSPDSDFTPPPGLFSTDGDLSITFLTANGVKFLERTDDPWYRGNMPGDNTTWNMGTSASWSDTGYKMDQAASPMACLRQFQFCNPALPEEGRCGPLAGFIDSQLQSAHLFNITYEQMLNMEYDEMVKSDIVKTPAAARYLWIWNFLLFAVSSPVTAVNVLGPNSLASQPSLTRSTSTLGTIPDNQWQLDVQNWWAIYMASMQAGMVNTAYGSQDPALKPYEVRPFNSHVKKLCNNQVSSTGACIEVAIISACTLMHVVVTSSWAILAFQQQY